MALFLSKILRVLVSFLMLFSQTAPQFFELPAIPSGQEVNLDERFELVWEEEFEGDSLDMTKWNHNWWEVERKGGYWHEDMVDVRDGNLVITTAYFTDPPENYYEDYFATHPGSHEYKEGWYTACITTKGKFEQCYGYFECRAILPASSGMWSAFWMMNTHVEDVDGSGQDGTEVDVFESMYYKDNWWGAGGAVISGIHYDGYGEGQQSASIGKWWVDNPYEQYNTYGLEWTPEEYIFYINGVETGRLSKGGVSQNPEYLILSCEVAGENGIAWADRHGVGEMSMDTDETAEFIVDYVRVYQHK